MWSYSKKLQYPVKIERPNPAMAKVIISQFGGPHGVNWVRRPGIFPSGILCPMERSKGS